jgi:hypothetical protein
VTLFICLSNDVKCNVFIESFLFLVLMCLSMEEVF